MSSARMNESATTKPAKPTTNWAVVALLVAVATVPPALLVMWWTSATDGRLLGLGRLLYWLMPLTFGFAGVCFVWRWRVRESSVAVRLREWWPGIVLAIVATLLVFWISPPQMRVQFDETCLVGTSQNMHMQRLAVMTTGSVPSAGEIVLLENMVDKRPTLFAFLVSVAHDLTGYRLENAFAVNGLLLALGLFVLFAATRARLGIWAGLSAPLLVLSVPLTVIVATSAGFELLATVLLLLATVAALAFVDKPSDGRLAAFVGVGVLLAQARYESILAVAMLSMLAAACVWRRYRPSLRVGVLLALCPTLVTPLFLLMQHAQNPNFTPEAGGLALLSLAHFVDHVPPFLTAWFGASIGSALPGWLAILAVFLWLRRIVLRQASHVDLFAVVPLALTMLVLAWFYGDVREPTALRLFLPLAWASLIPLLLPQVSARPGKLAGMALLVAAIALCAIRLPYVASGDAFPELRIATLTRELDHLMDRVPGDRATTLWVGVPAQHLVVKGHAAVSVRTFERLGSRIGDMQRRGDLLKVYLIETPLDADMAPAFGSPRDLLARIPSTVVERVGGDMPITVHRLGR